MHSFYRPFVISAPLYGYLKLHVLKTSRKGKTSKQGFEVTAKLETSRTEGRALTDRANRSNSNFSFFFLHCHLGQARVYPFLKQNQYKFLQLF